MKAITALLVYISVFATGIACAAPVRWSVSAGGNGHWYEYVPQAMKWTDAKSAAQQRSFSGMQGYLATITSEPERMFIYGSYVRLMWLGGYQDTTAPDYSEPSGGWRWVTGEPWQYTAWYPGEPNENQQVGENYLDTDGYGWNDTDLYTDGRRGDVPIQGYLVEYEPVPEPSSIFGLLSGMGGFAAMVLRKNTK